MSQNDQVTVKRERKPNSKKYGVGRVIPVQSLNDTPWLVQTNEPPQAFAYFQLYRDLGAGRSIAEVSRQSEHRYEHMADIAKRWRWKERVTAYDAHLDQIRVAEFEEAGRTMARRQAKLGMMLQEKATSAMDQLIYDEDNRPSAKDVATLADVGVKIERLARGENTEKAETIHVVLPMIPDWAKSSPVIISAEKVNGESKQLPASSKVDQVDQVDQVMDGEYESTEEIDGK